MLDREVEKNLELGSREISRNKANRQTNTHVSVNSKQIIDRDIVKVPTPEQLRKKYGTDASIAASSCGLGQQRCSTMSKISSLRTTQHFQRSPRDKSAIAGADKPERKDQALYYHEIDQFRAYLAHRTSQSGLGMPSTETSAINIYNDCDLLK